jgi:O-antigen ligase
LKLNSQFLDKLEHIYAFLAVQFSTGAVVVLLNRAGGLGYIVIQGGWLLIYVISLSLIMLRLGRSLHVMLRDKILLLLVLLACASVYWSTVPGTTAYRLIALIGTTLFGVYLPTRYNASQLLRLITLALSIGAILSLVVCIVLPSFGIVGGAWQGVYQHKNFLGRLMAINVPFLLVMRKPDNRLLLWGLWGIIGISSVLVVLSKSSGALVYFVVLVGSLIFYRPLRWRDTAAIPTSLLLLVLSGVVTGVLIANIETIVVDTLGKDLTFTGRTEIWVAVLDKIQERPWLGYGYGGFWLSFDGPSEYVIRATGWDSIPHSHNGYLDLALTLGWVGVVIFIASLLVNFVGAVRQMRATQNSEMLWVMIAITFTLLSNLSESDILKHNSFFWVFYIATALVRPALPDQTDDSELVTDDIEQHQSGVPLVPQHGSN